METLASKLRAPPITQLRPFHTLQQSPPKGQAHLPPRLVHWPISLQPRPNDDIVIRAFVELAARVMALDPGDAYCIQDATRGGFILAHRAETDQDDGRNIEFVDCPDLDDIPTDFSIGGNKALQLHTSAADNEPCLVAQADVVPSAALEALGRMLEDLIRGLQQGLGTRVAWTYASVLNFPPKPRPPLLLFPEGCGSDGQQIDEGCEDKGGPALLHRWFEQRAAVHPRATALDFLTDLQTGRRIQVTYQELDNAANALAAELIRIIAKPPPHPHREPPVKTVAVLMGPCPELYASYLAALKAGMAFCPIPVDAPRERQEALMVDLQPAALLVAPSQPDSLSFSPSAPIPTISASAYLVGDITSKKQPTPPARSAEADTAYILYTSGTTGVPKGVAISHLAAACSISSLSRHLGLVPPHRPEPVRWFQGAAPTFDISLFEIFWTLSTGSILCCAPRALTLQNMDSVLRIFGADITNITPSLASLLDPSSLPALMVGGETLPARLLRDFARYNPATATDAAGNADGSGEGGMGKPCGIYNGYGPTETAIYCIAQALVPAAQRGSVIGTPLATCGCLIVDERAPAGSLVPVPMGATGELVITGPQVSTVGYLGRPHETTAVFVDDAHWGRAYRTGDRARIVWDSESKHMIEFLGRMADGQVKLSGRRVELAEVEAALAVAGVAGVRETMACVWKRDASEVGSERVVSLVVTDPRTGLDFEKVRESCLQAANRCLPDYMRPFRILQVDSLPRTASGKLDRKGASARVRELLRDNVRQPHEPKKAGDGTWGRIESLPDPEDASLEEQLLRMVSETLCDGPVTALTATTPLVEAGMDSLRAIKLLRDVRTRWPDSSSSRGRAFLQPPLALLLDPGASIRSVFSPSATHVDDVEGGKKARAQRQLVDFSARHLLEALDKLKLDEADIEMVLPMTSTQARLALSFALDRRSYISHSALKLRPGVSAKHIAEVVEALLVEHAIYRCAMLPCDDPLSPFAQVVLTPEAWRRWANNVHRFVHRRAAANQLGHDVRLWFDLAEENMSLDSQRLYYIQVIEPEPDVELDPSSAGLLIVSMAHCICDGASLAVLMNDIARRNVGMNPSPRQGIYDAVLDWASNVDPETDELWRRSLEGWEVESFGSLSGNNTGISEKGRGGVGMVRHASSLLQWNELESRSRVLGASPLSILQASWALLLHLFSEADTGDVVFGSVISGQHLLAHAPTFSIVPCRVALPGTQTMGQLLSSLTDRSRSAQSHRHTSFGLFKTLPYNTVLALQAYPTAFELEEGGGGKDVLVPWNEVSSPAMRYDFSAFVEIFPTDPRFAGSNGQPGNMTLKLTYREDFLSELSATCILKQLEALTELMLRSDPNDSVQALPARLPLNLLSAEGTVSASRGTDKREPHTQDRTELLHSQFENQAAHTPDLIALTFYTSLSTPPINLSYSDLDARANDVAALLRDEEGPIIPLCLHRSVELYVAVLATLKAGWAWCPIDDTAPVQRRVSLIARTQSKVLLTSTDSMHLVAPCLADPALAGVHVLFVDRVPSTRSPRRRSSSRLEDGDLAYLLWTSGTTGVPKGVMVPHGAAARAMRCLQRRVAHDAARQVRTLQLSAASFDVFVQDLFYTWGLGGCVVSGARELVLGRFADFVHESRPTHAHLTPSFGASVDVDEVRGAGLECVTFIGEKLTEGVAEAWAATGVARRVYNTYGPAENAVVSTMRRVYGRSRDVARAANVGLPLDDCTAYVVREVSCGEDKRWQLVPRYGVGELALGGHQLASGYLRDEAKTARAFIRGCSGIDERIYLTGDVVRLNDHGFEFLGRNDDLVKVAGIRVELSEISAACASVRIKHPAVEHVETLHLPRPGGGADNKVVVTFVSVRKAAETGIIRAAVFRRAREMLPTYMVPGHVIVLDTTMPRTASNKVDRRALEEIYRASDLRLLAEQQQGRPDESPCQGVRAKQQWTEEQLTVLQAIADHFGVARNLLSPGDSLAGLGFGSLQVTKLAWSLRRTLSCGVGVMDLMRCQCLRELVDAVLAKLPSRAATSSQVEVAVSPSLAETTWVASIRDTLTRKLRGAMRPQDALYVLPATPIQESLIVETMVDPCAYWAHWVFDLSHMGDVDGRRLKEAWTAAAKEFDILRTAFVPLVQLDGEDAKWSANSLAWARERGIRSTILQLVRGEPNVCWNWHSRDEGNDLAGWPEQLQMELTPTTTVQPPWSVTFDEATCRLMLSMHHALYDGTSWEILLDTVARHYCGKVSLGESSGVLQLARGMELGLLPTAFQREEAVALWSVRLADVRETSGALNAPFPDLTQSRQKQPQRVLSSEKPIPQSLLTPGSASKSPGLSILLQSSFGCVLASYLELKAIVLGQTVSQRILHPDLARVMGPAMATLPVIVRADASSAEELWSGMANNSSSLCRTSHSLHPVDLKRLLNGGGESSNASFPALFVFHPAPEAQGVDGSQWMFRRPKQATTLRVEHPLALNVFESQGRMELTGDGSRISQPQLDLMLEQIVEQAAAMLEAPQMPLDQLTNRMHRRVVSISGEANPAADETGSLGLTDSVTRHAIEHPDWIAIEQVSLPEPGTNEGRKTIITKTVTYPELDKLANSIVAKLRCHGARLQPDDIVAMYLDRNALSLAATLAIFRAGYIYLPVDADLPVARKQLLFRDSKAKLLLTTEALAGDLGLRLPSDPPVLALPDGDSAVDILLSWLGSDSRQPEAPSTSTGGYLLYTSGTTGRPKGVRVSSRSLTHFVAAFSARLVEGSPATATLAGAGKYLNIASRAFDPHLTQTFVPWHLGHRVVLGEDRGALLGSLREVINDVGVTHFGSVPSVLAQLGIRPRDVPSVRVVTTGGEKASGALLDAWTDGDGQATLFNFYGPQRHDEAVYDGYLASKLSQTEGGCHLKGSRDGYG